MAQLVKNLPACGRPGFNPWVERSPREGKGYPLQYSCLENSMDCIVHGVTKEKKKIKNVTKTKILVDFRSSFTWVSVSSFKVITVC